MAFGWDSTGFRAKSEDPLLVAKEDVELLTETGDVPTQTVEAVGYDVELSLPGFLRQ